MRSCFGVFPMARCSFLPSEKKHPLFLLDFLNAILLPSALLLLVLGNETALWMACKSFVSCAWSTIGSWLVSLFSGLLVWYLSWTLIKENSEIPGVIPPSPSVALNKGQAVPLGYLLAGLNGIVTVVVVLWFMKMVSMSSVLYRPYDFVPNLNSTPECCD